MHAQAGSAREPRPSREPVLRRMALAPAIAGAIALLIGVAIVETDWAIAVRFAVTILAVICAWFALQAGQWWWLPLLAAIAIAWNPIVPFETAGLAWVGAHYVAIIVFLVVGALVRVPEDEPTARR